MSELLDHVVLRAVFLLNFVLEEFDGILWSCRVEEPGLLQDTDGFVHTTHVTEVCARRLVQDREGKEAFEEFLAEALAGYIHLRAEI